MLKDGQKAEWVKHELMREARLGLAHWLRQAGPQSFQIRRTQFSHKNIATDKTMFAFQQLFVTNIISKIY